MAIKRKIRILNPIGWLEKMSKKNPAKKALKKPSFPLWDSKRLIKITVIEVKKGKWPKKEKWGKKLLSSKERK